MPVPSVSSPINEPTRSGGQPPRLSVLQARVWQGAQSLGLCLSTEILGKLEVYAQLLAKWGAKMNLTAIPLDDPERIATSHFLDCLACVARLPPADAAPAPTLIDVGSGAGFPGAVCALLRPELRVTLVERVGKKAAFLQTLRRELGLTFVVESLDAERLIPGAPEQGFGFAVSRAALPPQKWLALALRLVAPAGYVLSMTSLAESAPQCAGAYLLDDHIYDVGAGSKRVLTWQRRSER